MSAAFQSLTTCLGGLNVLCDSKLNAEGLILVMGPAMTFSGCATRLQVREVATLPSRAHVCHRDMPARSICGREAWAAADWQGWGAGSAAQAACWAQSAASATDSEQTEASARDCCELVAQLRAGCAHCCCTPSSPEPGACGTLHIILCHSSQPARSYHLHEARKVPLGPCYCCPVRGASCCRNRAYS